MQHNFEMTFNLANANDDPLTYAPQLFESVPGIASVDAGERGKLNLSFCVHGHSLRRVALTALLHVQELIPGAQLRGFSPRARPVTEVE